MFRENGFRYFEPIEVGEKCPYFRQDGILDTTCGWEPQTACWPNKLKHDNTGPKRYDECAVYAQMGRGKDFVVGDHTATRIDLLHNAIRKYGLRDFGIGPEEYMALADTTEGVEGTHILHHNGRIFTIVVRGIGEVNGENRGIVRVVRRGTPSRVTTQPVFDHRTTPVIAPLLSGLYQGELD